MSGGSIDGWATAGVLDVGSGNTADPSSSGPPLAGGWFWKFEVADYEYITLRLDVTYADPTGMSASFSVGTSFKDYDYPTDELIGFGAVNETFQAKPWLKYWVIVNVDPEEDAAECTGITLTRGVLSATPVYTDWSPQLRDAEGNFIVISAAGSAESAGVFHGQLMDLNRDKFNPRLPGVIDYTWYLRVIEIFGNEIDITRVGPAARRGHYVIQQVLGGDDPIGADVCVWDHTKVGDQDHAYWNASGSSSSGPPTPPTCLPLPTDLSAATPSGPSSTPSYGLSYLAGVPGGGGVAAQLDGEEHKVARAIWLRGVRDNLPPSGVFDDSDIDLVAAGLPADYAGTYYIEYEDLFADFVQADLAADRVDQSESDDLDTKIQVELDLEYLPGYSGGVWDDHWQIGTLGTEMVPSPPTRKMRLTYNSGTPDWNFWSAILDWDDTAHWPDENPDGIVAMELDIDDPPAVDTSAISYVDIAVRVTMQAQRFRIVYFPPDTSVIRQFPRDDNQGWGSGTRFYPPTKANRTVGGIQ